MQTEATIAKKAVSNRNSRPMPPLCEPMQFYNGTPCFPWPGRLTERGYGVLSLRHQVVRAHRAVYIKTRGEIPAGMTIDHLCRNKKCVNPDHMEVVSGRVNTLRSYGPTALNARKTHCVRGHELSGNNLRIVCGGRECLACKKLLAHDRNVRIAQVSAKARIIVAAFKDAERYEAIGDDRLTMIEELAQLLTPKAAEALSAITPQELKT